jgi:outer membrane protein OmpA-like peptidoglycan-associated protein
VEDHASAVGSDRDTVEESPEPAPAPLTGGVVALQRTIGNPSTARVLALQRTIGNPSTARVLALQRTIGNRATARVLARWEGPEHQRIGDATGATIVLANGVQLTWGQVVAIAGDEYRSVEQLQHEADTAAGRRRLRARLVHDETATPLPAALEEPTAAELADTSEFNDLVMHNVAHFAAGGTALESWRSSHTNALALAMHAGLNDSEEMWQSAQLNEAFGQHFLTDMFSAGHVRTPRVQIMDWYATDFGPRVERALIDNVRDRLARDLTAQLSAQLPLVPDALIQGAISTLISSVVAILRGRIHALMPTVWLAISGAISGTLHDVDNREGIIVASAAHPEGWRTFGDAHLSESRESFDQATAAVIAARSELLRAREIGAAERQHRPLPPQSAPSQVYFGFDSAELLPTTETGVDDLATYLGRQPEVSVELVGHTDPLGPERYNEGLGDRRANAVAQRLLADGVPGARLRVSSHGERELVSTNPADYPLDRRVDFRFSAAQTPAAPGQDVLRAWAELRAQLGPPFTTVERLIPHELAGANPPQEDWRWGSLSATMRANADRWVQERVGPEVPGVVAQVPPSITVSVPVPGPTGIPIPYPVTVWPQRIVSAFLGEIVNHPTAQLGHYLGQAPGP